MTDSDLHHFATQIVKVLADPSIYRRANTALAVSRAKLPARGLKGGLVGDATDQEPKRLSGGGRRHGRWTVLS